MLKQTMFLAALLLSLPTWAVNKCAGSDGKVVFQDAPCADGAKNLKAPNESTAAKPPGVMSAADVARSFENQMAQPEMQKKIQTNVERRQLLEKADTLSRRGDSTRCAQGVQPQPRVGMSEDQFLNCTMFARDWDHLQINETETQYGVRKQYVYAQHAPIKYVYLDQGKITAISR
jgi:hypothetical protein